MLFQSQNKTEKVSVIQKNLLSDYDKTNQQKWALACR